MHLVASVFRRVFFVFAGHQYVGRIIFSLGMRHNNHRIGE